MLASTYEAAEFYAGLVFARTLMRTAFENMWFGLALAVAADFRYTCVVVDGGELVCFGKGGSGL